MRVELYPGHDRTIEQLPGMLPMLSNVAAAVAVEAKRLCDSQRIADEIDRDAGHDAEGPVARINANHWTSWFVEGGTVDQKPKAYLRRATESGAARKAL